MRLDLMIYLLFVGLYYVKAELETDSNKSEITKLELVDLGEEDGSSDTKDRDIQRKRDSGYSYKRPDRFTLATRARPQIAQSGHKGRIVNRHPSQINRPVTKYGPPGYQNSPLAKPGGHNQQHRDKFQHPGHFSQQHSNNFDARPSGLYEQEVPSPIRHFDFAEPNPIASQNDKPFAPNSANYLPPQNQKLPGFTAAQVFTSEQVLHNSQGQANLQSQSLIQSQGEQISDAALFLNENAQAIQELYGAPAINEEFAPHNGQFLGDTNQFHESNAQIQNFETSSHSPQTFSGPLPSYASGTLSPHETLEHIQSLEKDRLIVQLQRALATQSQAQTAEATGRYAQNQASFVQNQDLLASLGQRMKIHGLNTQQNTANFGSGSTAFNQSPFLPGTTISPPGFPLSYGLSTTTQTPVTTTTPTTTTGITTVQPRPGTKGDGTSQVSTSLPVPSQPVTPVSPSSAGFPVYGSFVPTLISGTSFVSNIPSYGPNFFTPVTVTPNQSAGSSPTHFGLPIPIDHGQKPILGSVPSISASTPPTTPSATRPSTSPSPPINALPSPVHPAAATPLHPVVTPLHPVATPVQPVTPLHPVLPVTPSHVHPAQTPSTGYPAYGLQTPLINPLLYKPIKPVYPLYYYPNVAYQLHKPALPTYPWSYAPSYAQTKPTQIWK